MTPMASPPAVEEKAPAPASRLEVLADQLIKENLSDEEVFAVGQDMGYSPEFMSDVLAALKKPVIENPFKTYVRSTWRQIRTSWRRLRRGFTSLTKRPYLFFTTANLGAVAVILVATLIGGNSGVTATSSQFGVTGVAGLATFISAVIQYVAFFQFAKARYPIASAAIGFLLCLPLAGLLSRFGPAATSTVNFITITVGFFLLAFMFGVSGLVVSLIGAAVKLRQAQKAERDLSRQGMLERLFQVRAKLQEEGDDPIIQRKRTLKQMARHSLLLPAIAIVVGAIWGLFQVLAIAGLTAFGNADPASGAFPAVTLIAIVGSVVLVSLISYFGGGFFKALASALAFCSGFIGARGLPIAPFGPDRLMAFIENGSHISVVVVCLITAAFAGWWGRIEQVGLQTNRYRSDDPARLVAELIELERKLNPDSRAACVLVVDVARSTAIKAGADQLDIEYTFRGYQDLVLKITGRHGGEVISTAGDGAIAGFGDPVQALKAAKEIQRTMDSFNRDVNRLGKSFRIRIGIHCGETRSDLQQAPYNELIDIAAHVEGSAPVGGIAVTEPVKASIPDEPLAEMAEAVDGKRVFIVLSPTGA